MNKTNWKNYTLEFLSIFIAVIAAFALENWNTNRRDGRAEIKILTEISNGLKRDIDDVRLNVLGHKDGVAACKFWRRVANNQPVSADSTQRYYSSLTRNFISIQNVSGYETLKSKGLEILKNDSLRSEIISLYEYDYNVLRKLEEEYSEMQFQQNYFSEFNHLVSANLIFDGNGMITAISMPLILSSADKGLLMSYLWKIETNRKFVLYYYADVENKIKQLVEHVENEINSR